MVEYEQERLVLSWCSGDCAAGVADWTRGEPIESFRSIPWRV